MIQLYYFSSSQFSSSRNIAMHAYMRIVSIIINIIIMNTGGSKDVIKSVRY